MKITSRLLFIRNRFVFFVIFFLGLPLVVLSEPESVEINGYIENNNGQPILSATIVLTGVENKFYSEATPNSQGFYVFTSFPSGNYRLEVKALGYLGQAREPIELRQGTSIKVNFSLQPMKATIREAEERGAKERNPNIFIRKVDLNVLRDPLRRRGIESVFLSHSATENQFLNDMGAPMRQILFVQPREPLKQFHISLYEAHENSALNARPFLMWDVLDLPKEIRQVLPLVVI